MSELVRVVDFEVDRGGLRTDADAASDAELLAGCRAGRADSWEILVRRYERLVYSVAIRCGLPAADAADVVQMTFMALLEARDLRDSERVAGWLVTVARRKAWQLQSRASRETLTADMPEPATDALSWEDVAVLHDALDQIDEPCRSLVLALYFDPDRPSYQEIAVQLDRSPAGIGPLRGRCLERLRVLLSTVTS